MKSKKNILFRASKELEPYGFILTAVVAVDPLAAYMASRYRDEQHNYAFGARFSFDDREFAGCLFFHRRLTYQQIVHETFHITHHVLNLVGEKFDANHQEPFAYLLDETFGWIVRALRREGINPR